MPFRVRQKLKASDLMMIAAQYRSVALQTITSVTNTKITLATLTYNYGGSITIAGSNTLTVNKTGVYNIGGGCQMSNVTGAVFCWVGNGSSTTVANRYATANQYGLAGAYPAFSVSKDLPLNAGDTLSLYIWHNHAGNRDTTVTSELLPYLYARYLGDG